MIKQMLVKWAELEPGVCQAHYKENQFLIKIGSEQKIVQGIDTNTLELAWMQYAVQQAIVARGWVFHLTPVHWRVGNFYEVIVVTPKRDGSHESENIAEALLSAYLKALGAT